MTGSPKSIRPTFIRRPAFYHVIAWILFISYEVFFVIILLGTGGQANILFDYVIPYMINISLFYFNAHYVLRKSFSSRSKSFLLFFILVAAELTLYLVLMNLNGIMSGQRQRSLTALLPGPESLRQLWRGIYFIGFSTAYWMIQRSIKYQKRMMEMERMQVINLAYKNKLEKNLVEVQNAYLQSQINPHLLFNTLNFIYNNVQEASEKASEAVILLSELMNYSLREQESDGKTSLAKEIEQIYNIIRINQIRFDNKLFLDIDIDGDFEEVRIIPLAMLVFIENVFKHGDLTDKNSPGKIGIVYRDNRLELNTANLKKKRNTVVSHGIGLDNIKKRLESVYKDNYHLTIENEPTWFYLYLSIMLNTETDDQLLHYR